MNRHLDIPIIHLGVMKLGKTLVTRLLIIGQIQKMSDHVGEIVGQRKNESLGINCSSKFWANKYPERNTSVDDLSLKSIPNCQVFITGLYLGPKGK